MKLISYVIGLAMGLTALWSCNEDTYIDPVQLTAIRGRVLYNANQRPVRNASVKLTPSSRVVATDTGGYFRFDSVVVGSYTIQASLPGYGTEVATTQASVATSPLVTILLTDNASQNRPPTTPVLVAPAQNSPAQSTTLTLKWTSTDPNRDTLTYDVRLYKSGNATPVQSYTGLTVDTLIVSNLDYNTAYLWQVTAKDSYNATNSPVFSFQTGPYPNFSYVFAQRLNGQFQVFGANAGGPPVQLTQTGSNWRPIVSPNRQQIAFISNAATDLHLFVMNADGTNLRQVTTVPVAGLSATDLSFSWSPDGTQLLYPSNDRLYAVRLDGTGLRTVAQAGGNRLWAGCDWTAQGNRIAARSTSTSVYDNEISLIAADGGATRLLYVRRDRRVGNPAFGVSGRQLVFSADSSAFQNEAGRQLDARMYLYDIPTNGLTDLSLVLTGQNQGQNQNQNNKPAGTNDLDPRFSPNGASVIFTNTDNTGNGVRSIYTSDIDGRNRKLLFSSGEMPYWRQ